LVFTAKSYFTISFRIRKVNNKYIRRYCAFIPQ